MTDTERASARAGASAVLSVVSKALSQGAKEQHGTLARMSHIAALAGERLREIDGTPQEEKDAVLEMLRQIQNLGHLTFIRKHGSEADFQTIGASATKEFRTPSGRWRKLRK